MKKIFALFLSAIFLLALYGCSSNNVADNSSEIQSNQDGSITYQEGTLSDDALFEIKDDCGKVWLDNQDVTKVYAKSIDGKYYIVFECTQEGGAKFSQATKQNIGKTLDISIDGVVIVSAKVYAQITNGDVMITAIDYDEMMAKFKKLTLKN